MHIYIYREREREAFDGFIGLLSRLRTFGLGVDGPKQGAVLILSPHPKGPEDPITRYLGLG